MTMRTKYLGAVVLVLLVCAGSGCVQEPQAIINDGDKVAFLGESITAAGANYGGYCRMVVHGLKARGIIVEPVFAGVPGNTSEHMLGRLDAREQGGVARRGVPSERRTLPLPPNPSPRGHRCTVTRNHMSCQES